MHNATHLPLPLTRLTGVGFLALLLTGCYAPLVSPGIPARDLPDSFRTPTRAGQDKLNLASLTIPRDREIVAAGDLLEVRVHGLNQADALQVRVLEDGTIDLPLVGHIRVAGKKLPHVRDTIIRAYETERFLKTAQVNVQVIEPAQVQVVLMGEVNAPGVYTLPRNSADVGRAIAMAGGLTTSAAPKVEVHRNSRPVPLDDPQPATAPATASKPATADYSTSTAAPPSAIRQVSLVAAQSTPWGPASPNDVASRRSPFGTEVPENIAAMNRQPASLPPADVAPTPVAAAVSEPPSVDPVDPDESNWGYAEPLRTEIPLAGPNVRPIMPDEVRLHDGDVISIPRARDEVFYVVGPVNTRNRTNFNIGSRELRELGSGYLLPRDRDIDVVTGVAMAGYIDPIESPTTVTVHRRLPDGESLLVRVDLIEARYDRRETILLQPGDIVYLNPDGAWWSRRFFDKVAPNMFLLPWRFWTQDWIVPRTVPL